jgi:hypothetical protein
VKARREKSRRAFCFALSQRAHRWVAGLVVRRWQIVGMDQHDGNWRPSSALNNSEPRLAMTKSRRFHSNFITIVGNPWESRSLPGENT